MTELTIEVSTPDDSPYTTLHMESRQTNGTSIITIGENPATVVHTVEYDMPKEYNGKLTCGLLIFKSKGGDTLVSVVLEEEEHKTVIDWLREHGESTEIIEREVTY